MPKQIGSRAAIPKQDISNLVSVENLEGTVHLDDPQIILHGALVHKNIVSRVDKLRRLRVPLKVPAPFVRIEDASFVGDAAKIRQCFHRKTLRDIGVELSSGRKASGD